MLAGTLGMTSILLFSRKIYSCFHWDCIAKRVDGVLLEMFLERSFLLLKSGSSYCTFGTVLANLIQNEVTLDWHGIMWV
jgi:hypothetical protein